MSYCVSSFYFIRDDLFDTQKMNWKEMKQQICQYGCAHPVKFVGISSFLAMGGVPIVAFLIYAVCSIIASVVGAIVAALFLLAVGITGLAFTLFFVGCATAGVVSMFSAAYFTYRLASCTVKKAPRVWPVSSPTFTETQTDEPFDKDKSHEIANMSQTLEQFLDSDSYNRTSDFYRTALVILALLFAIVVMFTLVVVTMSTLISVT